MNDSTYQPRGLELWAPAICATVAILAAALFVVGGRDFCLDDAWIHLSYAKSLAAGEGLAYNPGDRETGFSSPLWVALLALWPKGADPVASVKMLGALMHGLSAWFACALCLQLGHRAADVQHPVPLAALGLLGGMMVAVQPAALQGAVSGMEVPLCSALLLALGYAALREAWNVAALLAALSVWARPEMLGFCLALGVGCAWQVSRAAWRIPAGAGLAMLAWVVYSQSVSGYPLPNTYYIKTQANAENADALRFLSTRVLQAEPWLVGVGGLVSLGFGLKSELAARRPWLALWLGAWLATFIAIALTRPLNPAVTFYESRYFIALGAAPLIAVTLGFLHMPRWLALGAALSVFGVSGLFASQQRELMRSQETDIALLHTQPARYAAAELDPKARLMVEGAGAMRYWTPRSMVVLDALGLNYAQLAHAKDDAAKACVLVGAKPTHAALPDHIAAPLSQVFKLQPLQAFVDPDYAIVDPPQAMRVQLYAVRGVQARWQTRCAEARAPPESPAH